LDLALVLRGGVPLGAAVKINDVYDFTATISIQIGDNTLMSCNINKIGNIVKNPI
jgi:hypothetical protein